MIIDRRGLLISAASARLSLCVGAAQGRKR
jgi:hypothetical protein